MLAPVLAAVLALSLQDDLTVTFLGNEGFLLEAEGRKVLVDALVSRDMRAYVDQAQELRARLEGAEPPFDDVDVVLATHVHGDHFDAGAVASHLEANPRAVFVSTPQAVAALEREVDGFEGILDRVRTARPTPGSPQRFLELGVEALALHHGRERSPPVENVGWWIELDGLTLLHMGDTEVTAEELAAEGLDERGLDVALVPSWYLDAAPWRGAIEAVVRPRHLVVMHLAPRWPEQARTAEQRESRERVARIERAYPGAIVFRAPLERHGFGRAQAAPTPVRPSPGEVRDGALRWPQPKRSTSRPTTSPEARPLVSSVTSQRP